MPELAAVALALFGVTALISRWAGAFLLDRFPPRTVLAAGLVATSLSLAALALAHGQVQVLVAIAVVGLAFEVYEPASQELLARASTGERRHHTYAVMGVALSAAGAAAGLLAAVLLPLGVRWLVAADALTCLVAAVVAVTFLPRELGGGGGRRQRAGAGGRWRAAGGADAAYRGGHRVRGRLPGRDDVPAAGAAGAGRARVAAGAGARGRGPAGAGGLVAVPAAAGRAVACGDPSV
ncbi:MFS transporter [Nonomuraea sp. KM88]|uniref:MFS transporter n=1 Tax=Nonomuraea sp. KM88 TaxID=3457427 RepID=UPI003FCC6079